MNHENIKKNLSTLVAIFLLSLFSVFANDIFFATSINDYFYFSHYSNIYSLCLNNLQLNKVNNITYNQVLNSLSAKIPNCPSLIFANNKQQLDIFQSNLIYFTYDGPTGNNIPITLLLKVGSYNQSNENVLAGLLTDNSKSLELCSPSQCWNITSFYVFNKTTNYPSLSNAWSNIFLPNESLPLISFVIPNAVNLTNYYLKFVQLNRQNYVISDFLSVSSATLPTVRSDLSCAPLGDSIYCFGGYDGSSRLNQIVRYNVTSDTVTIMNATLPSARQSLSCAPWGDSIYCFGGSNGTTRLNQIVRYNVTSDTVTIMSPTFPSSAYSMSCVPFDDSIYCLGGSLSIFRYNVTSNTLTQMNATIQYARYGWSCAPFGDSIYCFGGYTGGSYLNQIVKYNVTSDTLTTMNATLPTGVSFFSCVPIGSSAYCFGGYTGSIRLNQIVRYGSYFLNQKVFQDNWFTQFSITNENLAAQTVNLTITYLNNAMTTLTNVQNTTQSNVKRIQITPSTTFVSKLYNFDNFNIISNVFYLILHEANKGLFYSFYVQDLTQQPIEGTTIIVLKRILSLNMYYPIFVAKSQVDGSASFFLYPNDEYVFYVYAPNHEDKMFSLIPDPNIRTIFVRLSPIGSSSSSESTVSVAQIDYLSFFKNLTFNLTPEQYYLNANTTTITFYVYDATNRLKLTKLQIYRVNLTNKTMIANLNSTNTNTVTLSYNIPETGKYEVNACIQKELTTTEQQIFAVNEYCIKRDYFLYIQEPININNLVSEKGYLLLAIIVTLLVMGFIAKFTVASAGWVGLGVFGLFVLFNNTALLTSIFIFSALALVAITFLKQYW